MASIGDRAFYECYELKSVYYSGTASQWASISFDDYYENPLYYASNLYLNGTLATDIMLEGITSINAYAFRNCTSLESVTIGSGVTSVGYGAFDNCTSLTYNEYENGYYLGNDNNKFVVLIDVIQASATAFTINSNTKIIYMYAFYNCKSLESITIPDSVTYIGSKAFYNCTSLESVNMGSGVTYIGIEAFEGCTSLINITIPNSVTTIDEDAFCNCTSLESVIIGSGVISIGEFAFENCTSLTSINIPDSVNYIGYFAFSCIKLTSVIFENTNGWYVTSPEGYTSGTYILSSSLSNTSKAATYLTNTYCGYYWYRSES